jgi:hypothetical protein
MQADINTHLSQSIGAGAFEGQHGMSFAISSAVADIDMSSAIAESEVVPAMTGRDSGPITSPAIVRIASSRRMVIWRFTPQNPIDTLELKASPTNDVVIAVASLGGDHCDAKFEKPKVIGEAFKSS